MLSKNITKLIQNLEKKKFRNKYNLFKAEGEKIILELLESDFKISRIFAFQDWIDRHEDSLHGRSVETVSETEMKSISDFNSLPEVMALVEIPTPMKNVAIPADRELVLALNGVQDPGNLGTIFRVADWFGIRYILCDRGCASIYNHKTVQASMGAIFRIKAIYADLAECLQTFQGHNIIFGTFLDGNDIYRTTLPEHGIIVMGNEGHGISEELEPFIDTRLTIPTFATGKFHTESLNVGVATGIILAEFRRYRNRPSD